MRSEKVLQCVKSLVPESRWGRHKGGRKGGEGRDLQIAVSPWRLLSAQVQITAPQRGRRNWVLNWEGLWRSLGEVPVESSDVTAAISAKALLKFFFFFKSLDLTVWLAYIVTCCQMTPIAQLTCITSHGAFHWMALKSGNSALQWSSWQLPKECFGSTPKNSTVERYRILQLVQERLQTFTGLFFMTKKSTTLSLTWKPSLTSYR